MSGDGLPDEDDTIVGTWYYFSADGQNIDSKYVFDADGNLLVYKTSKQSEDGYELYSQAKYRLRSYAGQMYVLPGDQYNVVTYEYDIKENDGTYVLSWMREGTTWKMLRVAE